MSAIRAYAFELSHALLDVDVLEESPVLTVYRPTDQQRLEDSGSKVRVGPVHYNTIQEIEKLGEALDQLVAR